MRKLIMKFPYLSKVARTKWMHHRCLFYAMGRPKRP